MCTREGGLWECGWDNRAGERGTGGIDANGLCNGNGIGLICGEGGVGVILRAGSMLTRDRNPR